MRLINSGDVYSVMVRIDELLGLALVIALGSPLVRSKKGGSYSLQNLPVSPPEQFYKPRLDFNLQSIASIKDARTRLLSLGEKIKSQTIAQEKQKTEYQVDYLQTQKKQAGALLSQLQAIADRGAMYESYSPRMAARIANRTGRSPIDKQAIEQGKIASANIGKIDELIQIFDQGILKARQSFESLKSL